MTTEIHYVAGCDADEKCEARLGFVAERLERLVAFARIDRSIEPALERVELLDCSRHRGESGGGFKYDGISA